MASRPPSLSAPCALFSKPVTRFCRVLFLYDLHNPKPPATVPGRARSHASPSPVVDVAEASGFTRSASVTRHPKPIRRTFSRTCESRRVSLFRRQGVTLAASLLWLPRGAGTTLPHRSSYQLEPRRIPRLAAASSRDSLVTNHSTLVTLRTTFGCYADAARNHPRESLSACLVSPSS